MSRALVFLVALFCLCPAARAQSAPGPAAPEPATLVPGRPVERDIKAGEAHEYRIDLAVGQFVRVRLAPRGNATWFTVATPDGSRSVEMFLGFTDEENTFVAAVSSAGSYRLKVEADGPGSYRLEAEVRATATPEDRERVDVQTALRSSRTRGPGARSRCSRRRSRRSRSPRRSATSTRRRSRSCSPATRVRT